MMKTELKKQERNRLRKQRARERELKIQESFPERLAKREKKMGRMFLFDDLDDGGLLVMAKHQDKRNIRSAWVCWVNREDKRIGLIADRWYYNLSATPEGLLSDADGKVFFLWEYLNLDGTPFKRKVKESLELTV